MSEELENEGTWSGLKKTILGTVATVVTAGGAWLGSTLFGGGEEAAPAPAAPVINITNSNTQQQSQGGGTTKVIERVKEVPAKDDKKLTPAKKKEGDEFKETPPAW
jgi:hypothetical protein